MDDVADDEAEVVARVALRAAGDGLGVDVEADDVRCGAHRSLPALFVQADDGEIIHLDGLVGFAEEHHAKW